jgi:3-deoxy-manno-octulosonate cytidylyltransferase (CMP-KDO synthetase)
MVHVVIPARYGATRLPGKPLRAIAGRPMIEHVVRRATESGAASVVVATDDERIVAAVEGFGGRAVMTSKEHASGTDRVAEAVAALAGDAVVVNVQGDEPCIDPAAIRRAASLVEDGGEMATLATPIVDPEELFTTSVVKVVVDGRGVARWFSRAPLPWVRGLFEAGRPEELPAGIPFLRHLGLYAYRADVVRRLSAAPPDRYELAESLEQLRALALGIEIRIAIVDAPGVGVDTEADLARAEALLGARP